MNLYDAYVHIYVYDLYDCICKHNMNVSLYTRKYRSLHEHDLMIHIYIYNGCTNTGISYNQPIVILIMVTDRLSKGLKATHKCGCQPTTEMSMPRRHYASLSPLLKFQMAVKGNLQPVMKWKRIICSLRLRHGCCMDLPCN